MMSDIILHHYQNSPFSEKARLMLGFKKLAWKSVDIPNMMPKPDVTALTGGYRRTPVMQIGADIYCDTALIADVLERLQPTPSLYPADVAGVSKIFAQWADSTFFWTIIPYCFQPTGVANIFKGASPEQMQAFAADRAKFRGTIPRMGVPQAIGQMRETLNRIEHMLADGRAYLFGSAASIADFSTYHCVWFVHDVAKLTDIFIGKPKLEAWHARMTAFGHGTSEKIDSGHAIQIAKESRAAGFGDRKSDELYASHLGEVVAITPSDYGLDPVEGELVFADATEFAIKRMDERAGEVVVHFPRMGFQLKKSGDA
jgi:glutathione S-transferase